MKKLVIGTGGVVVLLVSTAWVATEVRWTRTFSAPYPAIIAKADPATIARGRYLVFGPAACAYCHLPRNSTKW
jgi:mono/diheme cytochrome c family protein